MKRGASLKNMPLGMQVLVAYSFGLAVLNLVFSFIVDSTVVLGIPVSGIGSKILYSIFMLILLYMCYGILYPKAYMFHIFVGWYILSVLDALIGAYTLDVVDVASFGYVLYMLFLLVANGLTLGYVFVQKDYFTNGEGRRITFEDKLFVSFLSFFVIVSMIIVIVLGYSFYANVNRLVGKYSIELQDMNRVQALYTCDQAVGLDGDVCFIVIANSNLQDPAVCAQIHSSYMRYVCNKALEGV